MSIVGVIGAGMMGQGIAQTSAQFGHQVLLTDISLEIAEKGKATIAKTLDKLVGRGKLDAAEAKTVLQRITPIGEYAPRADADIVIEAATEREEPAPQLGEAELRRASAESLLAAETARSGLGAKFGRKRRLAPLTEELSLADEGLRQARLVDRQYSAAIGLRDGLTSELADRATAVARSAEVAAAESHAAAVSAWFERALAEATRVQVPVGVRTEAMSRGWGDAAPAVRRYLLVPQDMQLGTTTLGVAAGDPDGLVVVATPGLDRPLAAAILLGLTQPATEFS